jgi:type VI secretion system protein VasG
MRWKRAWTKPKRKAALETLWTEQKQLAERLLELRQQLAKAREAAAEPPALERRRTVLKAREIEEGRVRWKPN